MSKKEKQLSFFAGINTPYGFLNNFLQFYDFTKNKNAYIIKGGSGCGKSTIMKKITDKLLEKGYQVFTFPCSSDPNSLDGVYCPDIGFIICDGTSPHVIEPQFPVAYENIINLFDTIDKNILEEKIQEIKNISVENKKYHEKNKQLLLVLQSIINDNQKIQSDSILEDKLNKYLKNLNKKIFKSKLNKEAKYTVLFLSAITLNGVNLFHDTYKNMASKIYEINDEQGLISSTILNNLKNKSLEYGYDIIICPCPLNPQNKIDHLFIPELDIAFITTNSFLSTKNVEVLKKINCKNFIDKQKLQKNKNRLKFNKKATKEIIKEITNSSIQAINTHQKIEEIYISSIDFKKVNKITNDILTKIKNI